MKITIRSLRTAMVMGGFALCTPAAAQVTFYEHDGFDGRTLTTNQAIDTFVQRGFNDLASSVVVKGNRWEVCEHSRFRGRCVVLRPGRYHSLAAMGLNNRISSVRMLNPQVRVDDDRYAPLPPKAYDARRRKNERVFEAEVHSVKAVMVVSGRRCWVEREDMVNADKKAVPGVAVGAIIGGILGHQLVGGRGQVTATAGGAVAALGAGSKVASRREQEASVEGVRRCDASRRELSPAYWNVTYQFRGQEHFVQLTKPPGRWITVNAQGEPRA